MYSTVGRALARLHRLEARVAGDAIVLVLHGVGEATAAPSRVSTSWRTWKPYWRSTILSGTLPGRKPCIFTVRASFFSRVAISGLDLRDRNRNREVALERAGRVLDSLLHRIFLVGDYPQAFASGAPGAEPGYATWCEGRDSNPHAFRRWNLNPVRLPIPPLSRSAEL